MFKLLPEELPVLYWISYAFCEPGTWASLTDKSSAAEPRRSTISASDAGGVSPRNCRVEILMYKGWIDNLNAILKARHVNLPAFWMQYGEVQLMLGIDRNQRDRSWIRLPRWPFSTCRLLRCLGVPGVTAGAATCFGG